MKFTSAKQILIDALLNTAKAAATKSTIPALEGLLLHLEGNELTITGYDLEIGIKTTIEVNGIEDGEIVLNSKLFCDIMRKMPNVIITVAEQTGLKVILSADEIEYSIMGMSGNDYPIIPEINRSVSFDISEEMLKSMIGQTLFAISTIDTKPVHMGSKFEIIDNTLNVVSVDGVRMAKRSEPLEYNDVAFVVPGKTLNEIFRMLSDDSEKKACISIDRNQIIFVINGYTIISRLLEGDFIDYNKVMNFNTTTEAIVNVRELAESVDRTLLLISDKYKSPVVFTFEGDFLQINCETAIGKVNEKLKVDYSGEKMEIAFNSRYILDALKNSECDKVKFQMTGSLAPIKIVPLEGDSFTFIVLPIRLRQ